MLLREDSLLPTMRVPCRWRTLGVSLLSVIVVLNFYIFLTLPAQRHHDLLWDEEGNLPHHYDSRGVSHLQAPRRRLNKSNFSSDSLGADTAGGGAWEEVVVADNPALNLAPKQPRGKLVPSDVYRKGDNSQNRVPAADGGAGNTGDRKDVNGEKDKSGTLSRTNFTDSVVDKFITQLESKRMLDILPGTSSTEQEDYWDFLRRQRKNREKGIQLPAYKNYKGTTSWEKFHIGIHQHFLYDPDTNNVDKLLKDLTHNEIIDVEQKEGGTQIKLIITQDDEGQSLLKPMRFPRKVETQPDHFYFADFERHNAEIAAFHLDRVLGFNRVPPTAGRLLNISRDIRRLADSKLARTFFISPAGNLCFHGHCSYYCDSGHPICGHPDMVEGSMMAFLPPEKMAKRQTWRNPWKRSYSKHRKAYWEVYDDLCEKVKGRSPYNSGRRLLDIIDMSILDFLMGNLDRHHYETFRAFGNDTFIIHLDHGRGFGKSHSDDLTCLAPMLQCCMVRQSTLQRLVRLYRGPFILSDVMRAAMSHDQVAPILLEPHLVALDRRVTKILRALADCVNEGRYIKDVIVDDGVV